MGYTTEAMEAPRLGQTLAEPSQFELPIKEFVGYDPKGNTSVTGSPIQAKQETLKQPETVVEAETPPTEESIALSPKVSAIARKEQAQRQKEQALARREKELEAKLAAGEKFLKLQEKLKAKDYSGIDELGLSSNELASYEIDKLNSADPAEQRARKLEEEIANLKKAQEERVVEEYRQNQVLWKAEISKVVSENPEFAAVKKMNAEDIVLQHINDSFDEDGIELTAEQAAKEISDALKERAKKFAVVLDEDKPEVPKVLGAPKGSTKTITQTMTTTPKTSQSKPFHLMSESEQLAEAIRKVQAAKLQR